MRLFKKFWPHLLILFVIFISYGQTLRMYFWQDDSALIFKLQNQGPASGSFGIGIVGDGPYKYLVTPFVPFFPIFGIEPFGYFLVGFVTYILATAAFYFFVRRLFEKKNIAYVATLIFAAGYVGSDIMFRVINSWQTNIGLILAFLTFERLVNFLKNRSLTSYIASVILYFACTEFVFIRSHSLILPIFFIFLLFRLIPLKFKSLINFIILQIPFWIIFKVKYLSDSGFGGPGISSLIKDVLTGKLEQLSALLANTGNAFVPDVLQSKFIAFITKQFLGRSDVESQILTLNIIVFILFVGIAFLIKKKFKISLLILFLGLLFNLYLYKKAAFWYVDVQSVISGLVGIEISLLTIFWGINLFRKSREVSISLLFGWIFVVSQIFGYFIQYQTAIFPTTHRYFSYSLIGYAIFFAGLYLLAKKAKRWRLASAIIGLVLVPNLVLGFNYQSKLVENRSLPTEKFYHDLKKYVPSFENGSVFYFDIQNDGLTQRQFGDFFSVGSMPETTAIAIYYGKDRYDLSMVTEFGELIYKVDNEKIDLNKVYSFYYGKAGLVDTTSQMRNILKNGSKFGSLPIAPLTPVELSINLKAVPDYNPTLPYLQGAKTALNLTINQRVRYLKFLKNREEFYKTAKVSVSSEWKYREVENINDQNVGTSWQGHRIAWGERPLDQITIDLGQTKNVDRLIWHNWDDTLSAVSYSIEVSSDLINWQQVKKTEDLDGKKDGEIVVETFSPTSARYVRLSITKTLTTDSPAISEIMADGGFSDVDPAGAIEYAKNPFYGIANLQDWNLVLAEFAPLAKVTLSKLGDKGDFEQITRSVNLGPNFSTYTVILPPGGTSLADVKITSQFPGMTEIDSIQARNLPFEEIKQRGLIKRYSTN